MPLIAPAEHRAERCVLPNVSSYILLFAGSSARCAATAAHYPRPHLQGLHWSLRNTRTRNSVLGVQMQVDEVVVKEGKKAVAPVSAKEMAMEIGRRRTFAIISHPDAGKTTMTEKLLLYGGALQEAGAVKAKGERRRATSDFMQIEQDRGISISSTALQFEYDGKQINLLDTPGHQDFSEDTYRTIAAADNAVMLLDGAKGLEAQTLKLFDVVKMRQLPLFTFINKMDRPSLEPLELLDTIEKTLGVQPVPMTWPIGSGDLFQGIYDMSTNKVILFTKEKVRARSASDRQRFSREREMVAHACCDWAYCTYIFVCVYIYAHTYT